MVFAFSTLFYFDREAESLSLMGLHARRLWLLTSNWLKLASGMGFASMRMGLTTLKKDKILGCCFLLGWWVE
jgi:hypothetical protein